MDCALAFASMALAMAATEPLFFAAGGLRLRLAGSFFAMGAGWSPGAGGRAATAAVAPGAD